RHNLVNFSKFENKAEISSFLIDNVTDRFGRLKFKTEQMIKQEIDAENFSDSAEEKNSDKVQKTTESVRKETAKVLSKNSGLLGTKTIFVIFDIIANLTVFLALTKESKFLCILYIALLFVYPVYSFFSKSSSFDDLFGHCCMLFLVSAIFASIMFSSLIYRKTFLLIAALPTIIFALLFFFVLPKKNAKTEAERIINSVGADYPTLFARRVLIALLMSCVPLLLVNHIFDNQKEIVQQVTPFMQDEKHYAEVQIEKNGISEKLIFKLNTSSKGVNIKKPVYYRYRKGFLKMPTVLFFNKENHK
ncbi:hypothetical protein, partial [Treponema sp.]|uniref:hypothetical protein n=1 Tax=Treponema sp. TaxID=166 RepID=UPI00298D6CAB